MSLPSPSYVVWVLPVVGQVCLAGLMWRRKIQRRFPLFFTYTLFQVAAFPVKFYTYHSSPLQYFYAYWTCGAIAVFLGFAVIYEVFREVFRPFDGLRDLGSVLFRWASLVLVLAAILMAATSPAMAHDRIMDTILILERSVRVMQCGLVMLMLLCSSQLGLSWRHHVFGIALGFGLFAAVELVVVTLLGIYGQSVGSALSLAKSLTYNVAVFLWIGYLASPEPERVSAAQLVRTDGWDFALSGVTHARPHAPSLPLIEDAVDRVLQKTNGKNGAENGKNIPNLDV